MTLLRTLAKQFPGARSLYLSMCRWSEKRKLAKQDLQSRFESIYRDNLWQGEHSVSGQGSDFKHTRVAVDWIPKVLREYKIGTMLDVPCGDFHWMKDVDLSGIAYIGADIVPELIERNASEYASDGRRFCTLDLTIDDLPKSDLILCRDCLVHLSFADIEKAIGNMRRSGARYLLTTTFPEHGPNQEILSGEWRPLNLALPPFCFPAPLVQRNEEYDVEGGGFRDKSLALWDLAKIATSSGGYRDS